jgi:hypothetical protein
MNQELLQTIGISVITNGSVLALFVWVFKVAFEKALDQRAKLYEKELELQHKKTFHQFSKVYDEQAATLGDIYAELVELNDKAAYLAYRYHLYEAHPELLERFRLPKTGGAAEWERYLKAMLSQQPEDVKAEELADAASQALKAFRGRRIYLPAETASEVERLMNMFMLIGSYFSDVNQRNPETLKQLLAPEVIEAWKNTVSTSQALFPQLEEQFRKHLGSGH